MTPKLIRPFALTCSILVVCFLQETRASITLSYFFGNTYDTSNQLVTDGSLWAMVVDVNGDGFAGGFGTGQGLSTDGNANSVFSIGQAVSIGGVLGGDDIVFAMGRYDAASWGADGGAAGAISIPYNVNGVITGRNYAFYWFPEDTYTGPANNTTGTYSHNIGTQVGGFHSPHNELGLNAMTIPSDGSAVSQGGYDASVGGSNSTASMTATTIIPEPSTALLGVLGGLLLLRRRRTD